MDAAGTALGTGLQRLVALVGEVEGGRISLAALHVEHPLLGMTALQQQIQSHYLRAALPEIVKLVGSANVLGEAPFDSMMVFFWICALRALQHHRLSRVRMYSRSADLSKKYQLWLKSRWSFF